MSLERHDSRFPEIKHMEQFSTRRLSFSGFGLAPFQRKILPIVPNEVTVVRVTETKLSMYHTKREDNCWFTFCSIFFSFFFLKACFSFVYFACCKSRVEYQFLNFAYSFIASVDVWYIRSPDGVQISRHKQMLKRLITHAHHKSRYYLIDPVILI